MPILRPPPLMQPPTPIPNPINQCGHASSYRRIHHRNPRHHKESSEIPSNLRTINNIPRNGYERYCQREQAVAEAYAGPTLKSIAVKFEEYVGDCKKAHDEDERDGELAREDIDVCPDDTEHA